MISFKHVKGSHRIPSILVLATNILWWGMGESQQNGHTFALFSLYFISFKRWRLIIFKLNNNFACRFVFFTSAINCMVLLFYLLGRFSESSPLHSRIPFESSTHELRTDVARWLLTKRPRQLICWDQHM